jgi:serine/threonine-protein kinase
VSDIQIGDIITLHALSGEKFVVEAVRQGGMGQVLKLLSVRPSARPAALKTYLTAQNEDQFDREARAWGTLNGHPYIAELFWFGRWQNRAATLSPWYPRSLQELRFEDDPAAGITLIRQLVEALVYAIDQKSILHRDIKPANVLVDIDGHVRVSDFGLAGAVKEHEPVDLHDLNTEMRLVTSVRGVGGTPLYMAPELFSGAKPSATTEIYALGVTIYEFVTGGQHPYIGPETGNRFRAQFRANPLRQISASLGKIGQSLPSLVSLDPSKRPQKLRYLLEESQLRPIKQTALDVAVQAGSLRRQGRLASARELLERALHREPDDPVLLNGLSFVLVDEGEADRAVAMLRRATDVLRTMKGRYKGETYLDPVINLARESIRLRRFEDAAKLLLDARDWVEAPSMLSWYGEFGWTDLWRGDFRLACSHFSRAIQTRQITDDLVLGWFVLSAHLAREPAETFVDIGRRLIGAVTTIRAGGIALLVSNALPARDRAALINSIPDGVKEQLQIPLRTFTERDRAALSDDLVVALLRLVDDAATGGKYSSVLARPPG